MSKTIIIRINIFPRPVLNCKFGIRRLLFRNEDGDEFTLKHSAGAARVRENVLTLLVDRADPEPQPKR